MATTNERRRTGQLVPLSYGSRGPSVPLLMALAIIWLATGFQQCGVQASSSAMSASSVAERSRSSSTPSRHQHLLAAAASRKSRDVRYSESRTAARPPSQSELRTLVDQAAQTEKHFRQPSTEFLFDPEMLSSSLSSAMQLPLSGAPAHRRNSKHSIVGRELPSSPSTARSSRRKKLKADVFYAMRGRRRFDPVEESLEQEVFDEEPAMDTDVTALDGTADLGGFGIDGMVSQSASSAITDDDDGNNRVKDKREPPHGFHAIRGKRHLQY